MTQRINYSSYKNQEFICPDCNWSGYGREACLNFEMVMDLECPKCFKMLTIITAPTYGEILSKGSEKDRDTLIKEVKFKQKFDHSCLKSVDQLPEVEGKNLSFSFRSDTINGEDLNIIEIKGQGIWHEPMVYEGYERFIVIGNILKEKYGNRMVDLIPDETAEIFLYGDKLKAPAIIGEFRKQLRGTKILKS